MTAYGQSITTKWYRETAPKQLTKYEFAQLLVKALRAVGMVPVRQYWPTFRAATSQVTAAALGRMDLDSFNVAGGMPAGYIAAGAQWDDGFYLFDYPTTETFVVNGVSYRPCVLVTAEQFISVSDNGGLNGEVVSIRHARRRSDRIVLNDLWTHARGAFLTSTTGQNNFGVGVSTDAATTDSGFGTGGANSGGGVKLWNWSPSPGQTDAQHTALVALNNFHVVLSKTGLLIQAGNGTGRLDSNNVINCGFYFGGSRVPGRARVPMSDPNLNLIDPVVFVPHNDTQVSGLIFYETSFSIGNGSFALTLNGTHPLGWALGIQQDLAFTHVPVALRLYNIENLQRPFYPFYDIDTKGSPRLVDAVGSHILNRVVYMSFNAFNTSVYYGPIDTSLRVEPVPAWEDIWTFPWWRVADRAAPNGEYVDPSTGINWWLYYAQNMNCMFATEVEGITKLSLLPTYSAPAQVAETTYSMAAGFGAVAGATLTAAIIQGVANWTATPATDEATFVTASITQQANLTFVVPGNPADPASYCYRFSFQAKNLATAGSQTCPLSIQISRDSGATWVTLQTINNAGTTSGDPAFNYATYALDLPKDRLADGFQIRFNANRSAGAGTATVGVKDVRIQKLQ